MAKKDKDTKNKSLVQASKSSGTLQNKANKQQAKQVAKEPVKQQAKQVAKEPVKQQAKQVAKEPVKQQAKKDKESPLKIKNESSKGGGSKKDGKGSSLKNLIQKYGANGSISNKEAMKISNKTGASLTKVGFKANQRNVGLGANFANLLGSTVGQPLGSSFEGSVLGKGGEEFLSGLRGVELQKGQVYMGSSKRTTPASINPQSGYTAGKTTYTPIVGLKGMGIGSSGKGGRSDSGGGGPRVEASGGPRIDSQGGSRMEPSGGGRGQQESDVTQSTAEVRGLTMPTTPSTPETSSGPFKDAYSFTAPTTPSEQTQPATRPTGPYSVASAGSVRGRLNRRTRGWSSTLASASRARKMPTSSTVAI